MAVVTRPAVLHLLLASLITVALWLQANIKLSRAKLQAVKEARVQRTQRKRVARLLEASRHWVAPEELEQRIHQALDQPLPFGFVEPLITRQHQRL
ncbi:uncharacterized protein HaLaN_28255 [Haematococcus lacustris]|uniref:Uncharacterized protein n=1 Tax=Haematococcus lacustris TaxID=44745 RepID=A0A6A0ABC2_HAELA|nr:uncharacterized protein HaLaN_28255 [Haematococcus lacustris]